VLAKLSDTELGAWLSFLRAHHEVTGKLSDELEREHGMSLPYYEVLLYLAQAPDHRLRMTDLARSVLLSPSGLTRLVDRLVRDGMVERVPCLTDARSMYAVLTAAGYERFRTAARTHLRGIHAHFLSRLSDEQLECLQTSLQLVLDCGD
jgi:DNA-binding MarR family transcriptional regulator